MNRSRMGVVGVVITVALAELVLTASQGFAQWSVRAASRSDPGLSPSSGARSSTLHYFGSPLSADGRFVAFTSWAPNLVPGFAIPGLEVFLLDRETGVMSLLTPSVVDPTRGALGQSAQAVLAADGSRVAFASDAPDLVPGYSGAHPQVYLLDRLAGDLRLVSHSFTDPLVGADSASTPIQLSSDGRFLLFSSSASDLLPGASSTAGQLYLYDAGADVLTLVSHVPGSVVQGGNAVVQAVSADAAAERIAFTSTASDLVPGYLGSGIQIFLFRRSTGQIELVSHDSQSPVQGANAGCDAPAIATEGSRVVFVSTASNLTSEDPRGVSQVFAYDTSTHANAMVTTSLLQSGAGGDGASFEVSVSAGGNRIAFSSYATDLLTPELPGTSREILVFDLLNGERYLASHDYADPSAAAGGFSYLARIAENGSTVIFTSSATSLVPGYPGYWYWEQLYSWSLADGLVHLLTPALGAPFRGSSAVPQRASLVGDGSLVVFSSEAGDLVASDWNLSEDVFWAATDGSGPALVSRRHPELPGSATAAGWALLVGGRYGLSDDGRFALFADTAVNIVTGTADDGASHLYLIDQRYDQATEILPAGDPEISSCGASAQASLSGAGEAALFACPLAASPEASQQVWLWRRGQPPATLVSHRFDDPATPANGASNAPLISRGAVFGLFASDATDLVPGFSGSGYQVYLHDRQSGGNRLVSHATGLPASAANAPAGRLGLSEDGRWALLKSDATDLVAGYSGSFPQIFLFDAADGSIRLVSHAAGSTTTAGTGGSGSAVLSRDGRYVAFTDWAPDLVAPPLTSPIGFQVFLWDRLTDTTRLISHAPSDPAVVSNGLNLDLDITSDGAFVTWLSLATNLVPGYQGPQGAYQVYLWDRGTDGITLVSRAEGDPTRGCAYGAAGPPSISADGQRIAFVSDSWDLVPGDFDWKLDTYVFDLPTETIEWISRPFASGSNPYQRGEIQSQISADGRTVSFESDYRCLVERDWNERTDAFLASEAASLPFFADGFETGDTTHWSATSGG